MVTGHTHTVLTEEFFLPAVKKDLFGHTKKKMNLLCCCEDPYISSGDEVEDDDAENLTYVSRAAYDELRKRHNHQWHSLWNVTSGKVIGELHQTPLKSWSPDVDKDHPDGHDDWFPEKMGEIISRTKIWCDVLSLAPPDGMFMDELQKALQIVAENSKSSKKPVVVRMMFGNIIGMPVDATRVIKKLTENLPTDANLELWVGAWRKGLSWNHAKILAVDGLYLHTGGHNMWDAHYLKHNPVHDLSLELEGRVAHDGHIFANQQWKFIEDKQSTVIGYIVDKLPDGLPLVHPVRVTVSEYPEGKAAIFPPIYRKRVVPKRLKGRKESPVISLGRYGTLLRRFRPSDDAFIAMLGSAKKVIRMALQDLGPICFPGTKRAIPGTVWPHRYLETLATVIYEKGVDVEILLSNPHSIPASLSLMDACYGNGWSCVDVASEIIKSIKKLYPDAKETNLRKIIAENLRLCYIRGKQGRTWEDGTSIGMHAKHFIVDDMATYIGSQNLYVADLAEWGVVIDGEDETKKIMREYWNPMWKHSFTGEDCDVEEVMDGLDIDRDGEDVANVSEETKQQMMQAELANCGVLSSDFDCYMHDEDGKIGSVEVEVGEDGKIEGVEVDN